MDYPKSGPRAFEIPFAVNNLKKGTLLDIGQTQPSILRKLSKTRNITVLDVAKPARPHPRIRYITGDIRIINPGKFNNIWLISTLEHVGLIAYGQKNPAASPAEEQYKILKKVAGYLNKDGRIIVTVPCGTPVEAPKFALYYTEPMINKIRDNFKVIKEAYITSNKGGMSKWFRCKKNELRAYNEPGLLRGAVGGVVMMAIDG
jgi:hypothetical protein